jgi:N-acetylglucosaminyl-diphospho-decaprenol L-rhamnosyltransferase
MSKGKGSEETAPLVDVVIVNWNTGRHLAACVEALAASERAGFDFGVVAVVDNASTDDSLAGVEATNLPLRVIENGHNLGFAAACNRGAAGGQGVFVLFLNPDARVSASAIDVTVKFMLESGSANVGIVGGQMIGDSGAEEFSCARFPTFGMYVAKMFGLAHVFPNHVPRQRIRADELPSRGAVDQVIGAYFLIRRELFERLDGFDEKFFVYFEEVDLAFRARALGQLSFFLSDVHVHHSGQVSSDQVKGKRLYYQLRSRTEYARKHWPAWQAPTLAALTVGVELPVRFALGVARLDGSSRAAVDAWRMFRGYLRNPGLPVDPS